MNDTDVLFIGDLAKQIRCSVSLIRRMRRAGSFPIPELETIDKRPRWSGRDVRAYLERQRARTSLRRVR